MVTQGDTSQTSKVSRRRENECVFEEITFLIPEGFLEKDPRKFPAEVNTVCQNSAPVSLIESCTDSEYESLRMPVHFYRMIGLRTEKMKLMILSMTSRKICVELASGSQVHQLAAWSRQEEKADWEMLPTVHCACPPLQLIILN